MVRTSPGLLSPTRSPTSAVSTDSPTRWLGDSHDCTVKSAAGSKAIRLMVRPSAWARTIRWGATRPTPGMARNRSASPASSSCSVGWTVSNVLVMFTSVPNGTTTKSAPMRENVVAIPPRKAQPAVKLANPTPTAIITAMPRNNARRRRRQMFWAARRNSRNRRGERAIVRPCSNAPENACYSSRKQAKWNERLAGLPVTS